MRHRGALVGVLVLAGVLLWPAGGTALARPAVDPDAPTLVLRVRLHERVRLYLNICQRQATQREAAPQTIDERLYAATLTE